MQPTLGGFGGEVSGVPQYIVVIDLNDIVIIL